MGQAVAGMRLTVESVFRDSGRLCAEVGEGVAPGAKVRALALYALGGSALYGFTMGLGHSLPQALASAVKVPALFLLTLVISLPTLHFVGLLFGSRVSLVQSLVLLLAGVALTSILLGAFAPVALLFLASGSDYPFMLLLHVGVFTFCGAAGLFSVVRNFALLPASAGPARQVLLAWALLYMFVGTQTSWVLTPFVNREPGFTLFARGEGNFYTYVWSVLQEALRGQGAERAQLDAQLAQQRPHPGVAQHLHLAGPLGGVHRLQVGPHAGVAAQLGDARVQPLQDCAQPPEGEHLRQGGAVVGLAVERRAVADVGAAPPQRDAEVGRQRPHDRAGRLPQVGVLVGVEVRRVPPDQLAERPHLPGHFLGHRPRLRGDDLVEGHPDSISTNPLPEVQV
jgi:hypothetical protein